LANVELTGDPQPVQKFGRFAFSDVFCLLTGVEKDLSRFPLEVDDSSEADIYFGFNDFGWDSFNELSLLNSGTGEVVEGIDGEDVGLLLLLLEDVEEAVELSVELLETERPVAIPTLSCVERLDVFNPERFEEGDKMLSDDDEETESIFAFEGDSFEATDRIFALVLEDAAGEEVTTVPTEALDVEDFFEADNDATGDGEE